MNGLNRVFAPLKAKPIYKNRVSILCDQPDEAKLPRFNTFLSENGYLQINQQVFTLPCNGLEDYYPQVLIDQCTRENKVKKAKWMAHHITQEQFETDMPIMAQALNACWAKAFVTDDAFNALNNEQADEQVEMTEQ